MRPSVSALLLAAGCGGAATQPSAVAPAEPVAEPAAPIESTAAPVVPTDTKRADAARAQSAAPASDSAAPPGAFQWTGRYAPSREMCLSGEVWEITNVKVTTAGETRCTIGDVAEGGGRVRLTLSCLAEGMRSNERWTLTPQDGDRIRLRREGAGAPYELDLFFC
jgi:hypothetical protein